MPTTEETSVALHQRFLEKITDLSDDDLHRKTVAARDNLESLVIKTTGYAAYRLVPLCEEIRKRYDKKPGKYRLNGQLTLAEYFDSIKINYNTVRSWIRRAKIRREAFEARLHQQSLPTLDNVDNRPLTTCTADLERIERMVKRITSIADVHNIDLRPELTAVMKVVSPQLGGPEWADYQSKKEPCSS